MAPCRLLPNELHWPLHTRYERAVEENTALVEQVRVSLGTFSGIAVFMTNVYIPQSRSTKMLFGNSLLSQGRVKAVLCLAVLTPTRQEQAKGTSACRPQ